MFIPEAASEETRFAKMAATASTISKGATNTEKNTRAIDFFKKCKIISRCKKTDNKGNKEIEKENKVEDTVVFTKEELLVEPYMILTDDNHRPGDKHNSAHLVNSNIDDLVCVNDGHSIVTEAFAVQQASVWLSECPMQTLRTLHNRVIPILSSYMEDYAGVPSFLESWWMHNKNNFIKEYKENSENSIKEENNNFVNSEVVAAINISDNEDSELLLAPPPLTFHSFLANFIAITTHHACKDKSNDFASTTATTIANSIKESNKSYIVYSVLPSGRNLPIAPITAINLSYGTESVVKVLMREVNVNNTHDNNVEKTSAASLHNEHQSESQDENHKLHKLENANQGGMAVQDENDATDYLEEHYQNSVLSEVMHWGKFFEVYFDPLREGVCRDPLQLFTSIVLGTRIAHNKREIKLQRTLQLQAEESWKSISCKMNSKRCTKEMRESKEENKNMESVMSHAHRCDACLCVEEKYHNTLHKYMATHYSTTAKKLTQEKEEQQLVEKDQKCIFEVEQRSNKRKVNSTENVNSCKLHKETPFCSSAATLVLYIEYFLTQFKSTQLMRAKELNSIIQSLPKLSTPWCKPDKLIRDKTAVRTITDPFVNYDSFLYKEKNGKSMQPVLQSNKSVLEKKRSLCDNIQHDYKEHEIKEEVRNKEEQIQKCEEREELEEEEEDEEDEYDEEEEKMRMVHEQEVQQIKEQLQQLEKDTLTPGEVFFIRDWITHVANDEQLLLQRESVFVDTNVNCKNKKKQCNKRNRLLSVPLTCMTSGPVKHVGFDWQSITEATEHITHWVNSCVSNHMPLYVYELLHILREELPFVAEYNRLVHEVY